jgi:hypothetical protein
MDRCVIGVRAFSDALADAGALHIKIPGVRRRRRRGAPRKSDRDARLLARFQSDEFQNYYATDNGATSHGSHDEPRPLPFAEQCRFLFFEDWPDHRGEYPPHYRADKDGYPAEPWIRTGGEIVESVIEKHLQNTRK